MAFKERHTEILRILQRLKSVSVQTLTERLGVSEVTIRKDLTLLEEQGRLSRTHGGAVLSEDTERLRPIPVRRRENEGLKRAIARRARELVREDDTIYLDAGSTCAALAREIRGMSLRVVTNSVDAVLELSDAPHVSLVSLGGSLRSEAGSFIGPLSLQALRNFQIETCFLGATGISAEGRFSSQNLMEAQLKALAIERSRRCVVLADHTKYSVSAFSVFATADRVDVLVTDAGFEQSQALEALGIEVLRAV
jgi:DeoR/GlpR family transcriptional regulator of sugar metabolism